MIHKKNFINTTLKIPTFEFDNNYFSVHKEETVESNFGLDNTIELIDGGFGLYSSVKVRDKIGPLKSQFYRIGFCRKGSLQVDCGLETFNHKKDTIHFNFPGQLFSLKNKSADMYSYYILFSQNFIEDILPASKIQSTYPFLDYAGVPFFQLSQEEANIIESLFFQIDKEIKENYPEKGRAIKLLIDLILVNAKRSYVRQGLTSIFDNQRDSSLVARYKKLVAQHFIKTRSVTEYASKLAVSPKHLSKVIITETGKKASDYIDDMLMMEIKALLKHSMLNVSEIAYQLDFSDPSHLNKFFKKKKGMTPQQYRKQP